MTESTATLPGRHWHTVKEIIAARRSNGNVDPEREVPKELLNELLDLAVTAPNHYRTNPFRFVVLTGAARNRLGSLVADVLAKRPDQKESVLERQRAQYLR